MTANKAWTRIFVLSLIISFCSCVPKNGKVQPQKIHSEIAQDFVTSVCNTGNDFANSWLAHEQKYWDFYHQIYYSIEDDKNQRPKLALEMQSKKKRSALMSAIF